MQATFGRIKIYLKAEKNDDVGFPDVIIFYKYLKTQYLYIFEKN